MGTRVKELINALRRWGAGHNALTRMRTVLAQRTQSSSWYLNSFQWGEQMVTSVFWALHATVG